MIYQKQREKGSIKKTDVIVDQVKEMRGGQWFVASGRSN